MKTRTLISAVSLMIVAAHPVAAQVVSERGPNPVGSPEAIRHAILASAPSRARHMDVSDDWSAVRGVAAGTKIALTLDGAPPVVRRFVSADAESIVVLKLPAPGISRDTEHALIEAAVYYPERLARAWIGEEVSAQDVRISAGAVYVRGRRVAGVDSVFERVTRNRVQELQATRGRDTARAIAGAAIGAGIGLVFDGWLASHCSCDTPGVMIPTLIIGAPAGGALAGFYAFGHKDPEVVYRRPRVGGTHE